MRIITNTPGLARLANESLEVDTDYLQPGKSRFQSEWAVFKKSFDYDYTMIICDPASVIMQGFFHLLFFFNRCRLVSVDSVLPVPIGTGERVKAMIKTLAFKGVDIFIEYFRDTSGYERYYGIPKRKFRYTPFKINRYEKVLELIDSGKVSDQGYIFCGGNTRRDFDTLVQVARRADYPFTIVTMQNAVIDQHGSYLDEKNLPDNIEVVRHDGSDSFLDYIAGAKLVTLPVKKQNISASGIGVYIAAMALQKCVIISKGPSVDGIIQDEAILVPPEDVDALESAITSAYNDETLRVGYAERAQAYALSLGGEDNLYRALIDVLANETQAGKSDMGSGSPS